MDANCLLLRVLMKLLETSRDTTTLAVACHDLAQFVTFYPHGAYAAEGGGSSSSSRERQAGLRQGRLAPWLLDRGGVAAPGANGCTRMGEYLTLSPPCLFSPLCAKAAALWASCGARSW